MPLSNRQRRMLAQIERELSADPALTALSELFVDSPPRPADPPLPPEPTPVAAARTRPSTWVAAVLALLGIAGSIITGLNGLATVTSLVVVVVLGATAVVLANILRFEQAQAPRTQNRLSRL